MTRIAVMACMIAAVLVLAACGRDDEGQDATSTADDVLVIVTLTPVPSATVRSEIVTYTVQEGDTLLGIALDFGITPEDIEAANDLSNRDAIFTGQTLSIPAPSESTPEP
ncbi:hypothetical protein BH24CHL4_BH24CHL4_00230 [soil metagenome]